jgi:hypothetical protein
MNKKELSVFKLILLGDIGSVRSVRFLRLLEKFGGTEFLLKQRKKTLRLSKE